MRVFVFATYLEDGSLVEIKVIAKNYPKAIRKIEKIMKTKIEDIKELYLNDEYDY